MHRNRNDDNWLEGKKNDKRRRDQIDDHPLQSLGAKQVNSNVQDLNEDIHHAHKTQKDRAAKHLLDVQNMLEGMVNNNAKNIKTRL